jgi:hypothetical protein
MVKSIPALLSAVIDQTRLLEIADSSGALLSPIK